MNNHQTRGREQTPLPRLPVPQLHSTCRKFLEWARPLLADGEWMDANRIVGEFTSQNGCGERLQEALEEWATVHLNWLEPFWDDAYLCGRESLALHTNPFFCPGENILLQQGQRSQVERAVDVIMGMAGLKQALDRGTFPQDSIKGYPLCMYQYKRLFSSTRIPFHTRDVLRCTEASQNPSPADARHIVVIHKGHIYGMDVMDRNGNIHAPGQIKADLDFVLSDAENNAGKEGYEGKDAMEAVGMLTAMEREEWAGAREGLVLDSRNIANLDCIETALFAVCLDSVVPSSQKDFFMALLAGEEGNRWYDKSLQFIVFPNGQYGLNMEHTGFDASPVVRFLPFDSHVIDEASTFARNCYRLDFHLTDDLCNTIETARQRFRNQIANTDLEYWRFTHFGKGFMKSRNTSPDAFIQLAMQVAQFRMFGQFRSTYEAVMTRQFLHGRTEAMRPITLQAVQFVQSMDNPQLSTGEKIGLYRGAADAHISRLTECKLGDGVQRHLYGLECMHKRLGKSLNLPDNIELFSSTAWRLLFHDFLSTSTAGTADGMVLAGFAPVVDDGFGICYLVSEKGIHLTVSCRTAMKPYLKDFIEAIEVALLDVKKLLDSEEWV